jgi:ATP adenylyltransferase
MTKVFVNHDNAAKRPDSHYSKVISKIVQDGVCPFCPEYLTKYHPHPILAETRHWVITKNAYPYKGTKHHFLIVHKSHIERFEDISAAAWAELQTLIKDTVTNQGVKGGAFFCRFGDTKYTGASVNHLHAQMVVGTGEEGAEPVLARLG